ncbi:hypothetical protein BU15DRAFT_55657 [Melanogaster broomeanus]|nr:hypothetical protein BU15DRAFT_55657 [Melanogaster broomeanus]
MLNITGTEHIAEAPPPPMEDELKAFNHRSPGCIQITASSFRLDLSGKRTSPFNHEAKAMFADDFPKRVLQEGWYHFPPIPEKFMERGYIIFYLNWHMKHLRRMYRERVLSRDPAKIRERLTKSARSNRKTRLYRAHLAVLKDSLQLKKHRKLLMTMKSRGMSSDESGEEDSGHRQYRVITPVWRSAELTSLCILLDAERAQQWAPQIGHRHIRGNAPRERVRPEPPIFNEDAMAPVGLPCNCYKSSWYDSLRPFEIKRLKGKKEYDFADSDSG